MTTTWQVDRACRVIDGDSVRVVRSRVTQLGDDWFHVRDADGTNGVPIRLLWVDTPERGQPGYTAARDDLARWIADRAIPYAHPRITVVCHYRDAFGRILGDLVDDLGESASQWMMRDRGWPAFGVAS